MEAKTQEVQINRADRSKEKRGRQKGVTLFLVTLLATFVLGFTPDVAGFMSWLLARIPLAGALLSHGHRA